MKKIIAAALTISVILTSCGADADQEQASSAVPLEPVSIGVSFGDLDDNYISIVKAEFESLDASDDSITLQYADAAGSATDQITQLQLLITEGAEIVIVSLADISNAATICEIAKAGEIPVVFFGDEPPVESLAGYDNYSYVGVEQAEIGRLQAEMAIAGLADGAVTDHNDDGALQYLHIKGQEENPLTTERSDAVATTLSESGAELIAQAYCDWSSELATQQINSWIEGPEADMADAILCNSDSMAVAVAQAINAAGKDIAVYGIDAIPQAIDMIEAGEMAGTIYNDPYVVAQSIIEITADIARDTPATDNVGYRISNEGFIFIAPTVVAKPV